MENPFVLMTSSEEEEGGSGSNERSTRSEGMIKSKVDAYRKIADLSGFENLKTMMEAEASMPRQCRNKKERETGISAQEDANVNVAMEVEQLGKDATLNTVEKEEGNGSEKERRRNERRKKSKLDLYKKLNDLSGFENLKAMIEAEATLRTKKRNRKKKKGKIELCAQENDNIDADKGVWQLAEDKALKMVETSKLESLPISKITGPQNQVIDAANEDEGGGLGKTLQTTGADDVGNPVEVIHICSSPSEVDESTSDVRLGRSVQDEGKAMQTTKATGVKNGMNSVELEVINIVSSSSEDDGLVSDVSLGRSVEDNVKTILTTKATGADDRVNSVPVIDEGDKSISDVILGRNVENTMPADPVVGEKKRKRRRKKTKIKEKDTTDDAREGDDAKDNIVLRMLLRKPRYFNPPDWNLKTCSSCGKESHTAESCKAQKWKKPCFLCGSRTHIWKYCRKGQDCFIHKGTDRHANDCAEMEKGNSFNSNICLRCGDSGHDMFSCNGDYPANDLKEIQCYICRSFGHLCCVEYSNAVLKQVSCYNCGQSGHFGHECTKLCDVPGGTESSIICYKCGKEGHFARRCGGHRKDRLRISDLLSTAEKLQSKARFFIGSSSPHQPP